MKRKTASRAAAPEAPAGGAEQPGAGGAGRPDAGTYQADYIFAFEVVHQYPNLRSFIVKRPLKRSFMDSLTELFDGSKKRSTL